MSVLLVSCWTCPLYFSSNVLVYRLSFRVTRVFLLVLPTHPPSILLSVYVLLYMLYPLLSLYGPTTTSTRAGRNLFLHYSFGLVSFCDNLLVSLDVVLVYDRILYSGIWRQSRGTVYFCLPHVRDVRPTSWGPIPVATGVCTLCARLLSSSLPFYLI